MDEVEAALDDTNLRRLITLFEQLREKSQLIVITVVTPLSFVLNKLWTFAAVRTARLDLLEEHRDDDVRVE